MESIGERIKKRREELNMTQAEVARLLGYKSTASITKMELGKRGLPQNKIIELAKILQTTPEYLIGWSEHQPTKVPSQNTKIKIIKRDGTITEFDTSKIVEAINKVLGTLNEPARKKVLDYAEDLQENKKNLRTFVEKLQNHKNLK